jgi:hypothetical protein
MTDISIKNLKNNEDDIFNKNFALKTTENLTENNNLYYTDNRFNTNF